MIAFCVDPAAINHHRVRYDSEHNWSAPISSWSQQDAHKPISQSVKISWDTDGCLLDAHGK